MRKLFRRYAESFARGASNAVLFAPLVACGPSGAQDKEMPRPPQRPTPAQLREATHPGYTSPTGTRQECLGRLVFDAPRDMQWGVNAPGLHSGDRYRFTESMHGGHDDLWVSNVQVVVMAPAKRTDIERMLRATAAEGRIGIREYETLIETDKRLVAEDQRRLNDSTSQLTADDRLALQKDMEHWKQKIADNESNVAGMKTDWHPLDLDMPDALGYAAGPDLYAFVLRDGRAYKFVSASGTGEPPFEERQRAFLDMLRRFKFRKMHEVPKERGICVPYGFIPDDGGLGFRIEVSLRYADRPGVIYTVGTGVVGERGIDDSEPSGLKAIARAGGAGLSGALTGGRDVKRIGPRGAHIGALPAEQGGIFMNVADAGKPPVNGYSVYTGYGGWGHSRVLPYITVDMRSFTKEQEPTLKTNPPPVEESLARLDELLKSIRLRPTDLPMPELADVSK